MSSDPYLRAVEEACDAFWKANDALTVPLDAIESLASLPDDWSSYGAPKPNRRSIEAAIDVLAEWCARCANGSEKYEIGPANDGGVDITIENGDEWVSFLVSNSGVVVVERSADDLARNRKLPIP
jgi:hypothetical protein